MIHFFLEFLDVEVPEHTENAPRRLWQQLTHLNFFKEEMALSRRADAQQVAIVSTRLYIVSLSITMLVLSLFNGLTLTSLMKTEQITSIDQFENLYNNYPSTISCPCQQIAVPRTVFLSITPKYHQVRAIPVDDESSPILCLDLFKCTVKQDMDCLFVWLWTIGQELQPT